MHDTQGESRTGTETPGESKAVFLHMAGVPLQAAPLDVARGADAGLLAETDERTEIEEERVRADTTNCDIPAGDERQARSRFRPAKGLFRELKRPTEQNKADVRGRRDSEGAACTHRLNRPFSHCRAS
ncbi:hypothetical protein MTO96_001027 [Rhipicephalus appendiculatus]